MHVVRSVTSTIRCQLPYPYTWTLVKDLLGKAEPGLDLETDRALWSSKT